MATSRPPTLRTVLIAGTMGNILEWYDFALYATFAAIIASLFFPAEDPLASLLATFAVFAAGFLARPIGALLFGHYGDRLGRKRALAASILLMAIPTFCMGLLPTYAQVGAIATMSLTAALFFLRFWRETHDRLFLLFAIAFGLEGLNRTLLAIQPKPSEGEPLVYLIRLMAFVLILVGILDKNRQRGS